MIRILALLMVILMASSPAQAAGQTAHDFSFTTIDGAPLPLGAFKGKAVLVVNTASECGYTPQYKDLQALWQRHRDRGLVVLGVPSNDFGGQEPGSEAEIKRFCERQYAVDFPLAAKVHVTGGDAHPFYRWAAAVAGEAASPRWNFHKYLIGRDGELAAWFPTKTSPAAKDVTTAIEAALP
jgi:glutathione peroxidase